MKIINFLKKDNYKNLIIGTVIFIVVLGLIFKKPYTNTTKSYSQKLDSISRYYSSHEQTLDSLHKNTLSVLKTTYNRELESKEKLISENQEQISNLNIQISRYRRELNKSKSQFIYIEDGEVKFNDFYARGKKVIYKKDELEKLISEYDKTTELKSTIEKLNSITKELSKSVVVYQSDSVAMITTIDSLTKEKTSKETQIVELKKEIKKLEEYNSEKTYSITLGLNSGKSFLIESDTDGTFIGNSRVVLDVRKNILTIPYIKSNLYMNVGYENNDVIVNPYTNHKIYGGVGIEF